MSRYDNINEYNQRVIWIVQLKGYRQTILSDVLTESRIWNGKQMSLII